MTAILVSVALAVIWYIFGLHNMIGVAVILAIFGKLIMTEAEHKGWLK